MMRYLLNSRSFLRAIPASPALAHFALAGFLIASSMVQPAFAGEPDPRALARRIDEKLAIDERAAGAKDTAGESGRGKPAADLVFLRRASLDLIGRIPTVAEARAFAADVSSDKRTALIEKLTRSQAHYRHMAALWRRHWVPQADTPLYAHLCDEFEDWFAERLQDRTSFDRLAKDLLTVPFSEAPLVGVDAAKAMADKDDKSKVRSDAKKSRAEPSEARTPRTFLIAGELKAENLAANGARAFLGINLDCAQCHNHPFARWTREQFWQTAAFFARPGPGGSAANLSLMIPGTEKKVVPTLLMENRLVAVSLKGEVSGAEAFASWMIAKGNPYFAANALNRTWSNFFGNGLVEPLDDLSGEAVPAFPELFRMLTEAFVESDYDLNYLNRAIAMSRAYQRACPDRSTLEAAGGGVAPLGGIRALSGEQLYDSILTASGRNCDADAGDPAIPLRERKAFAAEYAAARPATAKRSVLQALYAMNGKIAANATDPAQSPLIAATADAPFLDKAAQLEVLYLATLGRAPEPAEATELARYLKSHEQNRKQALADLFWALLNSSEFNTNR